LGDLLQDICHKKLAYETVSLEGKFGGLNPTPEPTMAFASSVVRVSSYGIYIL
jgi:hypothetical protein